MYQNDFISGDINEILCDFDLLFDDILAQEHNGVDWESNLLGLVRYYRFRLSGKYIDPKNERTKKNKLNLFYLLNLLKNKRLASLLNNEDIISELYELSFLKLYPLQVNKLLGYYLFFSEYAGDALMQKAAKINQERYSVIKLGETPGLMGMAGKELMRLSPESKVSWIKLL